MNRHTWIAAAFTSGLLFMGCSIESLSWGAGEETTNGMVRGMVRNQSGGYAFNTQVKLYPVNYDPVKQSALAPVDTADTEGSYVFAHINSGYYNIQAVNIDNRTRALISGVHVAGDTVAVPDATVQMPGSIKVMLPDSVDATYGYVYVPGTDIFAFLNNRTGFVVLDSVPVGTIPAVYYSATNSSEQKCIRYSIPVVSGDTAVILNPAWKYARQLFLNTTASGANVPGTVTDFPVLIRLTNGNFNFSEANAGGNDIRFTKSDNDPLTYEIERWDSAAGKAEIWVKVDTVQGNDSTQYLTMYWGASTSSAALSVSNPAAVFDTTSGFQGVWHLNESDAAIAQDATLNHYNGTPSDTAPASISGTIGVAKRFDGTSNYIRMSGTANSRLNFNEKGHYSISAWVYADTLIDSNNYVVAGKGHEQYYLKLKNTRVWEFVEYEAFTGWDITDHPATMKSWKYIEGVRDGLNQYLYIDGVLASSFWTRAATIARNTGDDFAVGKYLRYVSYATNEGYCPYKGRIDEIRVCSVSHNADWVRLCYMNQKVNDALLKW